MAGQTKSREPHVGDKVSWTSSGGESVGTVVRKQTSRTKIKKHVVDASPDDPQFVVRSDKSGGVAAHKPEALKPAGDK